MASYDPYCRKPEPSHLILLNQVHAQKPGTKIRVLGRVHEYKVDCATLVLKGEFEHSATSSQDVFVFAAIENVLESIKSELLQVGSWVNIVGYVKPPIQAAAPSEKRRKSSKMLKVPTVEVLTIWSAGAIKLIDYQSAVRSFQSTHLPAG